MGRHLRRLGLLLAFAATTVPAPGVAQDEAAIARARAAFEQGRVAYEAGNFETALARFQEAHRLTGSPELLYNVGTVADRLRRDELALESYRGYLAALPGSSDRAQVEGRIRVLEAQISARARADDEDRERAAGSSDSTAPADASPTSPRAASGGPGAAPWIIAGVGGALAVAGVVLVVVGVVDGECVSQPEGCVADPAAPRWEEVAERYDRVPVLEGLGGALIGVGVAVAAVGLVWGLGADNGTEVAFGPGGFRLRGRF